MRRNLWSDCLFGILFSGWFAGNAFCLLISGFGLAVEAPVWVFFWTTVFALVIPVLLYFRFGWCALILLTVRGVFALWQDGELWNQIQTLAYTISSHYSEVYGWPYLWQPLSHTYELALILLSYLIVLIVSLSIRFRDFMTFPLICGVLPLALCLVTTDTLPAEPFLFYAMLGIVLFLITDWVRINNPKRLWNVFLRILVPSALALGLLFYFSPQETYVNHAAELQKNVETMFQQIKSTAQSVLSGNFSLTGNSGAQSLNLRNVGPKSEFSYTVMRVTSSRDGVHYLRGRDYDIYTGSAWESSEGRSENFPAGQSVTDRIHIVTYGVRNLLYTPYYPAEYLPLTDGYLNNSDSENSYSFSFSREPQKSSRPDLSYTDLPPETEEWAGRMLKNVISGAVGREGIVQRIGSFVRSSASYDLSTSVMSGEYEDFAQWFLEESDTGYCVHFATAAAVLLRAAGIPARYVEGYTVSCEADEKTLVANQDAHAWVEYYSDDGTWLILEATPAASSGTANTDSDPDETETEETEPEETEPEETEPEETEPDETEPEETEPVESEPGQSSGSGQNPAPSLPGTNTGSSGSGGSGSGGSGGGSGGGEPPQKEPLRLPGWVKKLAWILLGLAMIPLQGNLRILYRQKRWFSGEPNRMAVYRWKQSRRLAKLTKTELPGELEILAEKAVFSQYTLTREELYRFEQFRQKVLVDVHVMPWYRKYFLRWILAVG